MNEKIEAKLREIREVETTLGNLHRELGILVAEQTGAGRPGKMTVAGPAPSVMIPVATPVPASAADDGPSYEAATEPANGANGHAEGGESIPKRLVAFLNAHPDQRYSADELTAAIGLDPGRKKTVYQLLRREVRKKHVVGKGTPLRFGARA